MLKKRYGVLLVAVMATGLIAAGCGGDDDDAGDGGDALSKTEYVAQGNAICEAGNAETDAAAEELFQGSEPTEAEISSFATDTLVPNIQGQIDDLRALPAPEGDEDTLTGIYDEAELALQDINEDPTLIQGQGSDPFAEINTKLKDYGLTACGSEN